MEIIKKNVLKYLELAYGIYLSNFGPKHPDVANCLMNMGDFYEEQKQNLKSLKYYQKAIISELDNFSDSTIYTNPDLNEIEPQILILSILKGKAKGFSNLYRENEKVSDLDFSWEPGIGAITLDQRCQ